MRRKINQPEHTHVVIACNSDLHKIDFLRSQNLYILSYLPRMVANKIYLFGGAFIREWCRHDLPVNYQLYDIHQDPLIPFREYLFSKHTIASPISFNLIIPGMYREAHKPGVVYEWMEI